MSGLGTTGFMTLPVPVLGNTYANFTGVYWAEEYELKFGDAGLRSTPGPYWAVLWNRCFSIIDKHDHSGDRYSQNAGATNGRAVVWAGGSEYLYPDSDGFTSNHYHENGIIAAGDLDLTPTPGYSYSTRPPDSYAMFHLTHFGLSWKANIVNDIPTVLSDNKFFDWAMSWEENIYFQKDDFDDFGPSIYPNNGVDPSERYRLYARLRYSRITHNTATGSTGGMGANVDNLSYAPRIDLVWNNGSNSGVGTVLALNEPPGSRAKWWKFAPSPNPTDATQGYYRGESDQPYQGIVDKGQYGGAKQSITFASTNDATIYPHDMNSFWLLATDPGTAAAGALNLTLYDYLKTADPIQYPNQNQYYLSNDVYTNGIWTPLWAFFAKDSTGATGPTLGTDQLGYRIGTMLWVSDTSGHAGTGLININFQETQTAGVYKSEERITVRWKDSSTGNDRYRTWDPTYGQQGYDLKPSGGNYASLLLIKADRLTWFAYFV